ncbi:MAG: protein BatD [Bacteroidales bacterium]|nr:protein BatD [Bacteroidales bacterium]
MKKTGIYIMLLFLFSWHFASAAGEVHLIARGPHQVVVGQEFQITYEVNVNGENFTPPDFKGLQVLSGPNTSTSSSIQFINGQTSQSYNVSYSYIVMAENPGTIHVGTATISYQGKSYTSNELQISVVKGNPNTQSSNSGSGNMSGSQGGQPQGTGSNGTYSKDDVFIKASINNTHPYLGQQVVVTYKIYTRLPVSNLAIDKVASFKGLWSQDLLGNNTTLSQEHETIHGKQYVVAVIRKLALIPQQTGKLTIDPLQLQCSIQVRVQRQRPSGNDPFQDFFNDPFFNQNVRNINTTLTSNPVVLDVKPLPEKGQPADFSGAVGDFRLETSVNKPELSTNDALTLKVTITGKGNLELISPPKVNFPSDFETYDPKVIPNIIKTNDGISGSMEFDYIAIPRNPANVVISPVTFTYFSPADKKYHTEHSDTIKIKVVQGKGGGSVVYTGNAQEDIKFLGKDIHHIESAPYDFIKANDYLFGSTLFYAILGAIVLLLLLVIFLWKMNEKRRANLSLLKNRKANKVARTRLLKAQKLKKGGDDKVFYDEIAIALWGYIADKFNLKQSDLSMDSVKEKLEQKKVSEATISGFISTLNSIEFARFAPGNTKDKMENIYSEAMDAIMQAEKSLK